MVRVRVGVRVSLLTATYYCLLLLTTYYSPRPRPSHAPTRLAAPAALRCACLARVRLRVG
eukprot:scaffold56261_cov18-Phaeocystis_antarctica.AAC.1